MKIQIIAEGPTDRAILHALILMIKRDSIEFLEESNSQMNHRGKHSLISNYKIFAKFLHNAYHRCSDVIVLCVDNDGGEIDRSGIGSKNKGILNKFVTQFIDSNAYKYPSINPEYIIAVPVQTIDYWMKCIDEKEVNCHKIRAIEQIPQQRIKAETYGEKNIYLNWLINEKALNAKIEKIKNDSTLLDKLFCLPSFKDFEVQLTSTLVDK
ncbi:MAG: hypothetical protein WCW68_14880 [Methanothrix sp.]|jgi:hypothetical protein